VRLRVDPSLGASLAVPVDRDGEPADRIPVGTSLLDDPLLALGTSRGLDRLESIGDGPLDPKGTVAPAVLLGLPVEPRLPSCRAGFPALVAELLQFGAALGELVFDVHVVGGQQSADAVDHLRSKERLPSAWGVLAGVEIVVDDLPQFLVVEAGEDLRG
jgi:hypothetical protein